MLSVIALQDRSCQLLNEKWYTPGAIDNVRDNLLWYSGLFRNPLHHRSCAVSVQWIKCDLRKMLGRAPTSAKLTPCREQQKKRCSGAFPREKFDQLQGRGISPMQILDRDCHRHALGGAEYPCGDQRQESAPLLRGRCWV